MLTTFAHTRTHTIMDKIYTHTHTHCEGAIEELQHCPSLQSLILCNNRISVLHNIASCHQLWSINLTGNRVRVCVRM